jgi:hypothetical protein
MRTLFISSSLGLFLLASPLLAHAETPPVEKPVGKAPEEESLQEIEVVKLELPRPSQGYYIGLGAYGLGAMAFDKNRGTRDPTAGMAFSLRFGESLTPWLDLGLSIGTGWTFGDKADSLSLFRFVVDSQWHLNERWFIRAGFGAANGQGADPERLSDVRGTFGDTYLAGVGTNLYLSDEKKSGGWVLSPVVSVEVAPDNAFTTTSVWLGLEISWWSGLTRDRLDLPPDEAYAPKRKRRK